LILFLMLAAGCKHPNKSKTYESVDLPADDSTFMALKDTAQRHLQTFIDSLDKHGKDSKKYIFHVKSEFVQNDEHEHMWSEIYSRNNGVLKGVFADSGFKVHNIKTGDSVAISKDEIEDWSVLNRLTGKTIGEFSAKYLQDKLKADSIKKLR